MSILQGVILGFIQGLTEFLPVSSSGHLAVLQLLMGLPNELLFDVLLHIATLGAIIWFFRKEIIALRMKQWLFLAIATLPAAIVGLLANDWIEFAGNSWLLVALGFGVTGTINVFAQYKLNHPTPQPTSPSIKPIFIMGLFQSVALLPGISRSGTTVATALGVGMDRKNALNWAFLLAIPAIVGATGLEITKLLGGTVQAPPFLPTIAGMICAFATGLASLFLLRLMLSKAKLWYFSVYCFVLGLGMVVAVISFPSLMSN